MPQENPARVFALGAIAAALALAPHWVAFAQRTEFEVASVKPNTQNGQIDGVPRRSGTLITMHNTRAFSMVFYAYHLTANWQVVGYDKLADSVGYGWFDLDARTPEGATDDQVRLMMQSLLEDRFKLKAHRETRELPEYELTLGKDRPKLAEADDAPTKSFTIEERTLPVNAGRCASTLWLSGTHTTCHAATMATIADQIGGSLQAPIADHTGLSGKYDVHMRFASESQMQRNPDIDAPPLAEAVDVDLGLKLVKGKGPVEVLVIDHMEMPSGN